MESENKRKRGFIKDVIKKSQAENEPREFMIGIGVILIIFIMTCGGVARGFFNMVTETAEAVSKPKIEVKSNF